MDLFTCAGFPCGGTGASLGVGVLWLLGLVVLIGLIVLLGGNQDGGNLYGE